MRLIIIIEITRLEKLSLGPIRFSMTQLHYDETTSFQIHLAIVMAVF